ncbi:MAG: UDP-N-acetylmuramoyl-tripeptide--D-alanyl-D-alanine ligase [bacterium]|nr:UDP-N-acetylmuramoyl-tripeptide--D-alanyl-D-alanine ligase [bacterium]
MKTISLKILRWALKGLAKNFVSRYQPGIVAVTGSVGKTSTKEAIKAVLSRERRVRATSGNFNNEIGVPLTILGDWQKIEKPAFWFWARVILSALIRILNPHKSAYPEILVLEYAADRPGDIKYLLEIVRSQIAVVTAIGNIPAHVEFYSGPEALAREKSKIVEQLPTVGFAILNADDALVLDMKNRTRSQIMTFGFNDFAQIKITGFENFSDNGPTGIAFKLEYGGNFVPVKINGAFGKGQAYAAAAAACVGLIFGMNLVKIAEALAENFKPPLRRMNLVKGVKGTFIIDDSYNASPLSMRLALETLKELKAKRKVAVLGDMLEIGKYSLEAHEEIGKFAAGFVDLLITIGPRAKFIAEAAAKAGLDKENISSFLIAEEAKKEVELKIKKGDLILVKGSRAIGLDKVVEEIKQV